MTSGPRRPLIGVGVVVFKGDRVLLIRRGKDPMRGRWSLPGGRQRLGETVRAAARREVREEAGIEIEIAGLLDVIDSLTHDADGGVAYHYTLIDFVAVWRDGALCAGDDAAEACWADPDDLDGYDLWSETLRVIHLARAQRST